MSAKVAAKLIAASKLVGPVEKNGMNQHFKFKFQAWEDVVPAVQAACSEVGLWLLPSIVQSEQAGDHTTIVMEVTLIDSDSGETMTARWEGEGKDGQDKGLQKAATSAYKYLLLKLLMIPTKGIEHDSDGDGPAKATAKRPAKATPEPTCDDHPGVAWLKSLPQFAPDDVVEFKRLCKTATPPLEWKAEAHRLSRFIARDASPQEILDMVGKTQTKGAGA